MPTIRVQRKGGRGHRLIDKAKYDANPSAYMLCDDDGAPLVERTEPKAAAAAKKPAASKKAFESLTGKADTSVPIHNATDE